MRVVYLLHFVAAILVALFASPASALADSSNPCPRPAAGSEVKTPLNLYSHDGELDVALGYYTGLDGDNRTLFCLLTPGGAESPTLHVKPGDRLNLTLTNNLPPMAAASMSFAPDVSCGSPTMTSESVNLHFHGTNVSPICHSDEVIHTLVNPGEVFHYHVKFPVDEPPGLYWYHPHVHGIAEAAVLGGATGAIVVDGIENEQPAVAGLPERLLLIRDQPVAGNPTPGGNVPSWDVSLNYVPISYPALIPARIKLLPGEKEFWRVANTSADTIADIRLSYDDAPQTIEVVALDGVPTGSRDGMHQGKLVSMKHILLPPAGRAEFIMTGPPAGVQSAVFETLAIDTGPDGDNDTKRTLAVLHPADRAPALPAISAGTPETTPQRFETIDTAPVAARRKLYFSEVLSDPSDPSSPTNFFITVAGATPTLFSPSNPPAITATQGTVELWTIENRALESHEFHMHQIHFKLLERDGVPAPTDERQFLDTVQVPYWSGTGPYPSVTVAMDFRGPDIGDFVYHCHILGHEDSGMMAIISVVPPK